MRRNVGKHPCVVESPGEIRVGSILHARFSNCVPRLARLRTSPKNYKLKSRSFKLKNCHFFNFQRSHHHFASWLTHRHPCGRFRFDSTLNQIQIASARRTQRAMSCNATHTTRWLRPRWWNLFDGTDSTLMRQSKQTNTPDKS